MASRRQLEADLEAAKLSTSTSASDFSTLKARIQSLEASNRDSLALIDSRTRAHDEVASELSAKHQKTIELRREVADLEQKLRTSTADAASAKFREQGFEQEIESLKRNNDWLEGELKTKSAEYTKFRKERNGRISELQGAKEELTITVEGFQRTEKTLRTRLTEIEQKADEYLTQIQDLNEEVRRQEENFRAELDTANRLAELMKTSMNTEKQRQQELQEQLSQIKEDAADEIGRITAENQTEHQARVAAESQIAELEVAVERLEADATALQVPRTPVHSFNSPSRLMSPGPGQMRGSLSFTQLVNDYHVVKADLEKEKRRNVNLTAQINEMLEDMEKRQPEIVELQADHARLESDVLEMSTLIEKTSKECDGAKKNVRRVESENVNLVKETELLRQQLRDLSSQIKVLLVEVNAKDQGLGALTYEERARLELLARGETENEASQNSTDTDRFISQHLTTFSNVAELQEQNANLLRLTRELGSRMENEEAQMRSSQVVQDKEELENLRQKYDRCRDEIKSLVTQSQSYIQERDMFRRMLSHRGQLPREGDLASMFGDSVNGDGMPATPMRNQATGSIMQQSPNSRDLADYTKLIKELQSHFDTYKQEAATDRSMLKEEVDGLNRKNGELQTKLSRKTGEATLAVERYEMLHGNYNMLKSENSEMQKRTQSLSERAAKQDLRVQQAAEDLVEARGLTESLRNESANLKAEKEFWRSVENRLNEDNQRLVADRDRLNLLSANLQNLLNEREHADSEIRRRLQSQIDILEQSLQSTSRQLSEEVEESKRVRSQREYDNVQNQLRIDELVSNLSSIREEFVLIKSVRDHLQAKIDEQVSKAADGQDVSSNVEGLTRPSHSMDVTSTQNMNNIVQPGPSTSTTIDASDDANASGRENEEQLSLLIAELQRDLELAREQIGQYKAISQGSEEQLQNLNDTQEQYRQEMDNLIADKEARIQAQEQMIEELRTECSELKDKSLTLEDHAKAHGAEIARILDLNERAESAAQFYQQDLKAQADITSQAQQNYETELLKHAEAAKQLQKVRAELSQLKLEVLELKTERDTAQNISSQNDESWREARDRYESELTDIRSRRDDVNSQNKLLHQQLETVNRQIVALQQKRPTDVGADDVASSGNQSSDSEGLQEVIKYLRREKEIVDVQYQLSAQEAKRLRQQVEQTQSQLDEARLKLHQQRRTEEDSERSALTHNKLLETINELNLNRESNVTLRLEKNQAQASLNEKLQVIDNLQAQIQPLQAKIRELEDLHEAQEEDLRMTREARARFEQRYHDVLHKSDNIDPAEFEALKEEVSALQTERDGLVVSNTEFQEQVDATREEGRKALEEANERFSTSRKNLMEQAKNKAREQSALIREKDNALQSVQQEHSALERQLGKLRQDLDSANNELQKHTADTEEDGQVKEDLAGKNSEIEALQEQIKQSNSTAEAESSRSDNLSTQLAEMQQRVQDLEQQIATTLQSLQQANAQIAELKSQQTEATSAQNPSANDVQLEKLMQDLAQAQEDVVTLRASVSLNEQAAKINEEEGGPSIAEQIASQVEAIRAELTARHEERVKQLEESSQKRSEQLRSQLSRKLTDGKTAIRQELVMEHQQAMENLKSQHAQEMTTLNERHQSELDELRQQVADANAQKPADDTTTKTESHTDRQASTDWNGTEEEARQLIRANKTLQEVLKGSIRNHVTKAREEHEKVLAEKQSEAEKSLAEKLAEADTKALVAREQAVSMEGKKQQLKLNLAQNQARNWQAKAEYVGQASVETPEKAVSAVWTIAKDIKAPPAVPPAAPPAAVPATGGLGASVFSTSTSASAQPTAPSQTQPASNQSVSNSATSSTPLSSISAKPDTKPTPTSGVEPAKAIAAHEVINHTDGAANESVAKSETPQTSKLPDQPLGAGAARQTAGRGGTAARGSGIPMPASGRGQHGQGQQQNQQRGRGNIGPGRGRGAGGGRGIPALNTQQPSGTQQQPPSAASPMNPSAKQFVPTKRKGEEAGLGESQHAGDGKRIRGGGGGQ